MKCWHCYTITAIATSLLAFVAIFVVFDRNPAIDYGGPGDVYVQPPEVSGGGDANVCFKNTTWLRLCPSILTEHIQIEGLRFEVIHPHVIHPPAETGRLLPKCRALTIPHLPPNVSGAAIYSAEASSYCGPLGRWLPVTTKIEKVPFTVKPGP